MLPNKSSNIMMLDSVGQSSGPQPLLSTSVSPAIANFGNKQRRPKMDSNKSSHKGAIGGSHHQHHHHQHQSESKLYVMASIEPKDPLEITLEEAYSKLKQLICPNEQQQKPDNFSFNELSNYSNQSKAHYDEVCNALLYSILTDSSNGPKCLRNLFLCNNISFNFNSGNQNNVNNELSSNISQSAASLASSTSYGVLINNLHSIITENYSKLQDTPRQQLVWLLRELVKARVTQCEKLMLQMLRNIQSGSLAEKNYWLAESLLDILSEPNTQSVTNGNDMSKQGSLWIYSNIELLTQTVYTYLRIIADHSQAVALNQLRQRETEFCIQVLRERWNDCILIGRDLVRLLQNLAKLNEFEQLWRDIISAPQVLSPQFAQMGGLIHLMRQPTRRRCLISRLTIDMERKVYFIITSVKNGLQKRYLDWFQRQYLNTPESQTLRVDLIRYICVVVHPTNEQLNSGLTPRWSLCGWLINSCTSQLESANLKLALYYDWLLYDAKKDNIMLIEPAILLMFNSIRPGIPMSSASASLTNQLFDFLCRISTNYHWPLKDQILNGIMQSFKDVIEKRVIPSIQTFFNEPPGSKFQQSGLLDRDVKNLIHTTFGTFFQTLGVPAGSVPPQITPQPSVQSTPQPLMTASPKPSLASLTPEITSSTTGFSSFKRQIKNNESGSGDESSSHSFTSIDSTAADRTSFQSYFSSLKNTESPNESEKNVVPVKSEPSSDIVFKLDNAQFSSDDEENSNSTPIADTKLDVIKQKWEPNQGSNSSTAAPVSASYLALQKQLKQFCLKPVKIFSIEETNLVISLQNQFENHLSLIQSDDLREKLEQFNEKIKESQSSEESPVSASYLQQMFKEILNLVHRDPELVNNFTSSLSDVAVSICLALKIDFTNSLLPAQFYATDIPNFKSSKMNLNASDIDISQQQTHHVNIFSPNAHTLNLVNESINQRTIFILFKELSMTQNQSTEREIYTQLLHEIYLKQNRIGYYFLFYIYVTSLKLNTNKESSNISSKLQSSEIISLMKIYFEFTKERQNEIRNDFKAKQQNNMSSDDQDQSNADSDSSSDAESMKSSSSEPDHSDSYSSELDTSDINIPSIDESETVLGECYMQDLRLCQQDDPHLFCFMLPFICGPYMLQNYMCNNSELVYLVCSCMDSKQLKDLIATVTSQEILLVKHHVKNNPNKKNTRNNSAQNNRTNNRKKTNTSRTSLLNDEEKTQNKKRKRTTSNGSSKNDENKRNKPLSKKIKKSRKKKSKKAKNFFGKKNTLFNVLEASLLWESIEQIFFWQILIAHDEIDINYIVPLLGKLDAIQHAEAICYIFQMLKVTEPTFDLVKFLCKRRIDENMERALFVYWTRKTVSGETKLSQIFCKLLNKSATSQNSQQTTTLKKINLHSFTNNKKLTAEQQLEIANQQKSARTVNKVSNRILNNQSHNSIISSIAKDEIPSLDQVLFYLNRLRCNNNCINFILKENVLEALHKIYKKFCDDDLKKKYSDLFNLADEFEADNGEESDENSDDDSNNSSENESDSIENVSRNKKQTKANIKAKTKPKPGKQVGNKRAIRASNSKLPNKKIKLRNQNSSDSDKEDNDKLNDSDESDENDQDSDSSNENKTYKNSRKK